jgi:hypothetical protein
VVASFIEDPDRYRIRARGRSGESEAELIAFDLVNDLALLRVSGISAPPLALSDTLPEAGASVFSFGDPHGLGLSIVEGLYNGPAEKGVVDHMRLSMPLNPGMSGGPILLPDGRVVGTNVSIIRSSNAVSFGVPLPALRALLAAPRLSGLDTDTLRAETGRQLLELEARTAERLRAGLQEREGEWLEVGRGRMAALPSFFECGDDADTDASSGVDRARLQCGLQFTPREASGAVSAVQVVLEHQTVRSGGWGFFGHLAQVVAGRHGVSPIPPGQGSRRSTPSCVFDRVRSGTLVWSVNTCVNAYRHHQGLFDLSLVAVSVDRPREALVLELDIRGFRLETSLWLSERILKGARLAGEPS